MVNGKKLDPTVVVLPCLIVFRLVQLVVRSSAELLQSLQNTLSVIVKAFQDCYD